MLMFGVNSVVRIKATTKRCQLALATGLAISPDMLSGPGKVAIFDEAGEFYGHKVSWLQGLVENW